jgi:hypothetical protein
MSSVFDQESLKVVELKPCPFCGDSDVSSYVRGGTTGIVECPCGAQMSAELPYLERDTEGRSTLSEQQIQMLERFRKKHRLATQVEAVSLWSRCLAVDAWNLRAGKSAQALQKK